MTVQRFLKKRRWKNYLKKNIKNVLKNKKTRL